MEDQKDVKIRELEAKIHALEAEIKTLKKLVAELTARLSKNSSNSSKPPSSDIVSPPKQGDKNRKKTKRKQGAQKGHTRNLRVDFTSDQIDSVRTSTLSHCPDCGGKLLASATPDKILRQIEWIEKPFRVTEYRRPSYCCADCGKSCRTPLPEGIFPGLFGSKLKALTAWAKGVGRLSFKTLQRFLSAMFQVDVSTGYIADVVREVSDSLAVPYAELSATVRESKHVPCDETGLKENGKKRWVWVARSNDSTIFKIAPSRGSQVLTELLSDDFSGTISCDFYGAYQKFAKTTRSKLQFCWAHLIREFRAVAESAERKTSNFGKRIVRKIQAMFSTIHRRGELAESAWSRQMNEHKKRLMKSLHWGVPDDKDAQNLVERLTRCETDYFRFIDEPIPPTNNPAEQTIRKVAIARKISQGTRSDWGNRWLERFWSVETSCEQRGQNLLDFITQIFANYLKGAKASASGIS
ncbi:MAG: IS66 family transposase [Planctomycetia bacterium]|nr:IS66 family transposase [Planctomycetia bacterium]